MDTENPNYKHARDASDKFDNYFPVLGFSVLALSIQSFTWSTRLSAVTGIVAICLIFLSCVLSIWKLEQVPHFFHQAAVAGDKKEELSNVAANPVIPTGIIAGISREADAEVAEVQRINARFQLAYQVQRLAFVVGMAGIIFSRISSVAHASAPGP